MPEQLEPKAEESKSKFDFGDTSIDPVLDSVIEDVKPTRQAPPKGPDGKFLPRSQNREDSVAEPPQPQHPRYLVKKALDLGYSQKEIASLGTEVLAEQVHAEETRELRELRKQSLHQKSQEANPTPFQQLTAATPSEENDGLELDDETRLTMSTDVLKMLKRFQSEITELRGENKKLTEMETVRQNMTKVQIIDRAFESIGASEILGTGSIHELNAAGNTQAIKIRQRINHLANNEEGDEPIHIKIRKVFNDLYGHVVGPNKPQRDPGYDDVDPLDRPHRPTKQEWNEAAVARPDSRSPHSGDGLPKGEQRALHNASRKMGMPTNSNGDDKSQFLGN